MTLKRFSHFLLALALIISTALTPFQKAASAQAAQAAPDMDARLAAIEKALEEKRKELHIPGLSLVIVKDDKVVYAKGLGLKDVEHNLPVTEYFSDYRLTDGVMIPYKTVTNIPTIGDIVSTVKTVKFGVEIPDTVFRAPEKQ